MDNDFEEGKQNTRKEVAFKENTISVENLPYPTVLYPGHYGTFFGFKINNNSPTVICSCVKSAVENYIKLRMNDSVFLQASKYRKQFILCNMHFPRAFVDQLKNKSIPNDSHIINHILFEQKLCHECNKAIPRYKYCDEMYGGAFKQYLGWYINKQAYDFGIDPMAANILRDRCPQDIL